MPESAAAGTLGLLAAYFLKTTIVLTLALLAAAAARRYTAAFRHFVLSSALIGLLLLPFLSLVPVDWKTPLMPAWMAASTPGAGHRATEVRLSDAVEGSSAANLMASARLASFESENPAGQAATLAGRPVSSASTLSPETPQSLEMLGLILGLVWPAGFVILIIRLVSGLAGAARLTAQGTPLSDPAWRVLLERFLAFVSLRRRVRLKSHPEVFVPLTWGWRKPVVLLPAGADTWTAEERSSALFHELSHIKRRDFLVMMFVRTSLAIFWWNPFCWVVYRRLLKEQEIACDELVLRAGIRPSTYAASLLAFRRAAGFRWNPSAALLGMLGRSPFQERLAAILRQKLILMEVKMKTKIMLALALVAAVALIGTARPADGREASEQTAVIADAALPAPSSFDVVPPAVTVQEQEKEAEKEKDTTQKKIIIKTKEGDKTPIEVIITEGDQVKKLVFDKPLTITKGKDGEVLLLTSEGKEIKVLKGEPVCLEIKSGDLEVIKEGKAFKIGRAGVLGIVKEGDEGCKTIVISGKPGEPSKISISSKEEIEKGCVKVAKIIKEGEPKIGVVIKEPGKAFALGRAFALSSAREKELLEKVQEIREQVKAIKAKKLEIEALEESLNKLEAEIKAKEEKVKELEITLAKPYGDVITLEKVVKKTPEGKSEAVFVVVLAEKGLGREAYERAVAKLKKELPEGYKLVETEFEEEAGTMSFKIAPPEGQKGDDKLVQKLIESLREDIKKK